MAVQQYFTAGIAAVKVRAPFGAGFLVDPAGFSGIPHLLQVPVQLLPARLAAVIDRVVAHLAVGDLFIDLPPAVDLAVELAFGLDAGFVVGVDQPDFRGAPHPTRNNILTNNVCDVQQIYRLQLYPGFSFAPAGRSNHLVNLAHHCHHRTIAAGGAAKGFEPFPLRADGIIHNDQTLHLAVFPVGQKVKVMLQRLGPALLRIADRQRCGIPRKSQVGVFQPFGSRHRVIGFVQDFQVGAHRREFVCIGLQHPYPDAAAHHQQVEQVMIGRKAVDNGEGTVVVGHRVGIGHRCAADPQRPAGQKLSHMIDVVIQLFGFFAAGRRERAVVFYGAAHSLPPEFPPPVLRQIA